MITFTINYWYTDISYCPQNYGIWKVITEKILRLVRFVRLRKTRGREEDKSDFLRWPERLTNFNPNNHEGVNHWLQLWPIKLQQKKDFSFLKKELLHTRLTPGTSEIVICCFIIGPSRHYIKNVMNFSCLWSRKSWWSTPSW